MPAARDSSGRFVKGSGVSPAEAAVLLGRIEGGLPELLRDVLGHGATRIAGRAIGTYMRDAKGEGRRDDDDNGPLRRVSGRLSRAAASRPGNLNAPGGINRISLAGAVATLDKGIDLDVVPYARRHEENPDYSYLAPSLSDEQANIEAFAQRVMAELVAGALA
jgi:hypothetical protein